MFSGPKQSFQMRMKFGVLCPVVFHFAFICELRVDSSRAFKVFERYQDPSLRNQDYVVVSEYSVAALLEHSQHLDQILLKNQSDLTVCFEVAWNRVITEFIDIVALNNSGLVHIRLNEI